MDTWTIFLTVKQLKCETNHLFPYSSDLSYIFMEWCLIKQKYKLHGVSLRANYTHRKTEA
jgi:hypothetical protein